MSTQRAVGHDVTQVSEFDLPNLTNLLAAGGDHAARLRDGDACLVAWADDQPTGLLWLNLNSHVDKYLGHWSNPSSEIVYYNQLQVATEYRRRGIAESLVLAAVDESARRGLEGIRAAILTKSSASSRLHDALGFRPVAVVRGARLGPLTARLPGVRRVEGR